MAKRNFKSPALTFGRGINDADYVTQVKETGWICPFFLCWKNMMRRAYSAAEHAKRPSYIGTTVCVEWHSFMSFRAWMSSREWEGKHLDKDLLCTGNREYRPDRCCFVSREINSFLTEADRSRGAYPVGVYLHKSTGKYAAQMSEPCKKKKYLGLHDSICSAHNAWLAAKHERAQFLATSESNKDIALALCSRYANGYHKQVTK